MKWFFLTMVLGCLNSCATVGSKNLEDFGNYIGMQPGITTKAEVYDRLGQPADVVYGGAVPTSSSKWTYVKADMHVSGWNYVPFVGLAFGGVAEDNMVANVTFDQRGRFTALHTEKDTSFTSHWVGLTRDVYRVAHDPKGPRVAAEMSRIGKPFDKKFAKNLGERRLE
jgi:hypothetical protein